PWESRASPPRRRRRRSKRRILGAGACAVAYRPADERVKRRRAQSLLHMAAEGRPRRQARAETPILAPSGRHGVNSVTRTARSRASVSLCVIARDDAAGLERCLVSAMPVVDEIIVVDTGSHDDTPTVALTHGATLVHAAWTDDFAAARNLALDVAHGTWV